MTNKPKSPAEKCAEEIAQLGRKFLHRNLEGAYAQLEIVEIIARHFPEPPAAKVCKICGKETNQPFHTCGEPPAGEGLDSIINEYFDEYGSIKKKITYIGQLRSALQQAVARVTKERDEAQLLLGEAQQWIDSEPDWKDKYHANLKLVLDERDQLLRDNAQIAGLREALKKLERVTNLSSSIRATNDLVNSTCKQALSNQPNAAADELVKDRERLDWLEKNSTISGEEILKVEIEFTDTLRTAIDCAIKQQKENRP